MVSFESQPYSKRLLQLVSWSHWFTFFNIGATILLSSIYILNESIPQTLLGKAYLITTWLSHMAFITFMGFMLILFPVILVYPRTRFIRAIASLIYTFALLLLIFDAFIYTELGYHLNFSSISPIFSVISHEFNNNNLLFWLITLVLLLVILAFELTTSNYAWKHIKTLQQTRTARFVVTPLVLFFFISHLTHIWADANLEYDILRQDTVLPLSYPTTAKTLLTKYGMFNEQDYNARKRSPLIFTEKTPNYPSYQQQCHIKKDDLSSVFIVLTDNTLTEQQLNNIKFRIPQGAISVAAHIDNASNSNAWFNLLYSLPTIYKEPVLNNKKPPLLMQIIADNQLHKSFTIINPTVLVTNHNTPNNNTSENLPEFVTNLFPRITRLENISSLIFTNKLNHFDKGLHVLYFKGNNSYQLELFLDAVVSAQNKKNSKDIIWLSSIGNKSMDTSLTIKPALLVLPNSGDNRTVKNLTSHMDIQSTLIKNWLSCDINTDNYTNGIDINTLNHDRIIANTTDNGIVVFNKDKSVFIDQNGKFESYSIQLAAPITEKPDFPLMINGVHFIKKFTKQAENVQ